MLIVSRKKQKRKINKEMVQVYLDRGWQVHNPPAKIIPKTKEKQKDGD